MRCTSKNESISGLFLGKYRIESARLKGFDYASAGSYFVTIDCRQMGKKWFGEVVDGVIRLSEIGRIIKEEWLRTPAIRPEVTLDEYQIMPDHFHAIVMIHASEPATRLGLIPFVDWDRAMPGLDSEENPVQTTRRVVCTPGRVVCTDKSISAKSRLLPKSLGSIIGQFKSACTKRIRAAGYPEFQWHSLYWDRIIRDKAELDRIRIYIRENPKKWKR